MARGRRRRNRNFVAIPFETTLTLSTLANDTVLSQGLLAAALGEDLFVISIHATWSLHGLTGGEVPITTGFHHSDLAVGEVLEALEAEVTDPDDVIARERARRPVRKVGTFSGSAAELVLNNGVPVKRAARFSVGDGHNISMFALNRTGATLTTGATITVDGVIYGRWQR